MTTTQKTPKDVLEKLSKLAAGTGSVTPTFELNNLQSLKVDKLNAETSDSLSLLAEAKKSLAGRFEYAMPEHIRSFVELSNVASMENLKEFAMMTAFQGFDAKHIRSLLLQRFFETNEGMLNSTVSNLQMAELFRHEMALLIIMFLNMGTNSTRFVSNSMESGTIAIKLLANYKIVSGKGTQRDDISLSRLSNCFPILTVNLAKTFGLFRSDVLGANLNPFGVGACASLVPANSRYLFVLLAHMKQIELNLGQKSGRNKKDESEDSWGPYKKILDTNTAWFRYVLNGFKNSDVVQEERWFLCNSYLMGVTDPMTMITSPKLADLSDYEKMIDDSILDMAAKIIGDDEVPWAEFGFKVTNKPRNKSEPFAKTIVDRNQFEYKQGSVKRSTTVADAEIFYLEGVNMEIERQKAKDAAALITGVSNIMSVIPNNTDYNKNGELKATVFPYAAFLDPIMHTKELSPGSLKTAGKPIINYRPSVWRAWELYFHGQLLKVDYDDWIAKSKDKLIDINAYCDNLVAKYQGTQLVLKTFKVSDLYWTKPAPYK